MSIKVESSAFGSHDPIPREYTGDGANASPPLAWQTIPPATQSLVLICDDPDAPGGTWVHWVCYDIPPAVSGLDQGIPGTDALPVGGMQGRNDFGRIGYGGPCPPGGTHRYVFKVYALDAMLKLPAGKTSQEIEKAMQGHLLASGELIGIYSRKQGPVFTKRKQGKRRGL